MRPRIPAVLSSLGLLCVAGLASPALGDDKAKEKITFARETYTFNFPGTPEEFVTTFKTYYGPTTNAFEAAAKNGREAELERELNALFRTHNKRTNGDGTSIPATFLRVTVEV